VLCHGRFHGKNGSLLFSVKLVLAITHRPFQRPGVRPGFPLTPGLAEEEALKKGMEEKSREFAENGSELYAKA
jgi:hypothetical protein